MSKFGAMALPVDKHSRMFIMHPITNEPLVDESGKPGYVDVYSSDSDRARAFNRKSGQRRLDMRGRAVVNYVTMENDGFSLLAELTAGWHLVDLEGRAVDCQFTSQNARELYAEPGMAWLREQVDAWASARGNFAKPSATSSSNSPSESSQASES